ncbi:Zinc finger, RING/FYVE/PHD-type [Corchorus olitorius]|uniref:Zinc finger, RING/FYVE/PHD-type n=1 Tax=Corchorus olitorius TaxID=93759 RepID=A0A1R3JAC4_9ROSI|nr:Zinc finger, RING/FYVE/PHD-type [Corchorus olitorius]
MATLDSDVPMVPVGEASSSAAPSSSTKKPKRFEIKKWSAVALWAWDIVVDNCAICRNHIMDLSPPVRNALLLGFFTMLSHGFEHGVLISSTEECATMHFTSTASADGSRLVKCVHWIIVSGSSRSMVTRYIWRFSKSTFLPFSSGGRRLPISSAFG